MAVPVKSQSSTRSKSSDDAEHVLRVIKPWLGKQQLSSWVPGCMDKLFNSSMLRDQKAQPSGMCTVC